MRVKTARVEVLKKQSAREKVVESQLNLASSVQALGEYWGTQAQHWDNQAEEWHDAALFCREQRRKIMVILEVLKKVKISFES